MEFDKYPRRHPQVASRVMDEQAIVVLADSGEVNVFSPVATRIWELVDGKHTLAQIVATITAEYEVAPEMARQDVQEFVQELLDVHAITLDGSPLN